MLNCFCKSAKESFSIHIVMKTDYQHWLQSQTAQRQSWLKHMGFSPEANQPFCLLSDAQGGFAGVLLVLEKETNIWQLGGLVLTLPENTYHLETKLTGLVLQQALIAWGLGAYQFTQYKKAERSPAKLVIPSQCHFDLVANILESIYLVRDLINTPTEDMGPLELAEVAVELSKEFHATVRQTVGEELLEEVYPAIYTVGRASTNKPRLIDLRWGDKRAPKVTLVGKGVCFDSGGLDLKPSSGMALMKKDMGGAAHVLGLARMMMKANLPVCLRVLIPAVENAVSGSAYRPGDVITMRNGKTVEVTNTDAEGRLVLGDALVEASSEKPELLIDFATLTGAARVAVGTEVAALFSNSDSLANDLMAFAQQVEDPIWRLPLHESYQTMLASKVADMVNSAALPYAGAITAGLFLQNFVGDDINWLHFDIMGWNVTARPAHPEGGEAMGLRALFDYLRCRFSKQH